MAKPMSAERFLDRWQNYRQQTQQVYGIRALHAAIASLDGGALEDTAAGTGPALR
jgi:hypothetical protein